MASKYRAVVTEYNGRKFASKTEAKRAAELELLQRGGKISNLEYQPRFTLIPQFLYHSFTTVKKTEYVGDFGYYDCETLNHVVEDVKGFETPLFKLKQKLFWKEYPMTCVNCCMIFSN